MVNKSLTADIERIAEHKTQLDSIVAGLGKYKATFKKEVLVPISASEEAKQGITENQIFEIDQSVIISEIPSLNESELGQLEVLETQLALPTVLKTRLTEHIRPARVSGV